MTDTKNVFFHHQRTVQRSKLVYSLVFLLIGFLYGVYFIRFSLVIFIHYIQGNVIHDSKSGIISVAILMILFLFGSLRSYREYKRSVQRAIYFNENCKQTIGSIIELLKNEDGDDFALVSYNVGGSVFKNGLNPCWLDNRHRLKVGDNIGVRFYAKDPNIAEFFLL